MGIELTKKKQSIELVAASGGEEVVKAYDKGYNTGYSLGSLPVYYMNRGEFLFNTRQFPQGTELVLRFEKPLSTHNAMFSSASGIRKIKFIADTNRDTKVDLSQLARTCNDLEELDLSEYSLNIGVLSYLVYGNKGIKRVKGALNCTNMTAATNAFSGAPLLEEIEFEPNTIPINLSFSECPKLIHKSLLSILNGLQDFSGTTTTKTLTLNKASKNLLTEEEKQIATKKGWTIA